MRLTHDTALIAINGSGSGDIFFDDIEINDGRLRIGAMDEVADTEEDLPGEKVREQGRRRGKKCMFRKKSTNVGAERGGEEMVGMIRIGHGGGGGGGGGRRRERKEIEEISSDTSLHSLEGTRVNDHS